MLSVFKERRKKKKKKKKRGNGHEREREVPLQPLPILGLKVGGLVGQVVEKVGSE